MNSMLNNWPIDPAVVIIALGVITLLLLIMTVICIMQTAVYTADMIILCGEKTQNPWKRLF